MANIASDLLTPPTAQTSPVHQAGEGVVAVENPFAHLNVKVPGEADYTKAMAGSGDIVAQAKKMLGTPYKWGGSGLLGVDCSGFVQYVYKQMGKDLPRMSNQQANAGQHISLDKLKTGDLVAWDNSDRNAGADHIAIYIGNGQIIEAAKPGTNVKISNLYDQGRAWGVRLNS